jgi:hypothetical protein
MKTLVVDTGVLLRLADGNLLNTLLIQGINLVIPDAVVAEATLTGFKESSEIRAWLTKNKDQLTEPHTREGDAITKAIAAGISTQGKQFRDNACIEYAFTQYPGIASNLIIASEDGKFKDGIPEGAMPGSTRETTLGVINEGMLGDETTRQDALIGISAIRRVPDRSLVPDPKIFDYVQKAGTFEIKNSFGEVIAKLVFLENLNSLVAGNINFIGLKGDDFGAIATPDVSIKTD